MANYKNVSFLFTIFWSINIAAMMVEPQDEREAYKQLMFAIERNDVEKVSEVIDDEKISIEKLDQIALQTKRGLLPEAIAQSALRAYTSRNYIKKIKVYFNTLSNRVMVLNMSGYESVDFDMRIID